jgi:D-alanyl-lipoteichoic acid acyltransferase DltB (MBOAT superfamily)
MLFPTFDYFLFLPLVAVVHWLLQNNGWRTGWLFVCSLVFYAAWNPLDTVLLGVIIGVAYLGAQGLGRLESEVRWKLAGPVVLLLMVPLLYYKYLHFAAESLAMLLPGLPVPPRQRLPIGISFYTFQAIAYVIDIKRGQTPEKSPLRFATFLLFFPHLVAGPILRASVLLKQLESVRVLSRMDIGYGVFRLCQGLIKKVLVADVLRIGMVDTVFTDPTMFTPLEILVALYAYTLQIYCDFSGYTDFAIGSARLLGFHIPENFDRPYQALSVGEYWRRWHITLSDWVRDYVYYPMGGSRVGGWKVYRNTFLTLLILAVWHGANWTFVLYGILHGTAVSLHRFSRNLSKSKAAEEKPVSTDPDKPFKALPGRLEPEISVFGVVWRWLATFHFVVLARILFRADDITHATTITTALFQPVEWVLPRFSYHAWIVLFAGYLVHLSPKNWAVMLRDRFAALPAPVQGLAIAAAGALCMRFGPGDSLAFIYYSF